VGISSYLSLCALCLNLCVTLSAIILMSTIRVVTVSIPIIAAATTTVISITFWWYRASGSVAVKFVDIKLSITALWCIKSVSSVCAVTLAVLLIKLVICFKFSSNSSVFVVFCERKNDNRFSLFF